MIERVVFLGRAAAATLLDFFLFFGRFLIAGLRWASRAKVGGGDTRAEPQEDIVCVETTSQVTNQTTTFRMCVVVDTHVAHFGQYPRASFRLSRFFFSPIISVSLSLYSRL